MWRDNIVRGVVVRVATMPTREEWVTGGKAARGRAWRMPRPTRGYGEVGRCGERSTSRVISLGAKTRNGGPQKPVPRLV
ncbi:hypothetical protein SAMN05216532_1333 [Streptomyces sp. 2231.1]|nr:hypothetical protein SAMN05216532_1333 [Streptomyces sp. 2231.1]